jgi:riboflavin biosynthesis pyrimidine reductase
VNDFLQRFAAFGDRKTREAAAAALPPYTTIFDDHPGGAQAVGNDWSRALFDGPFFQSPLPSDTPQCNLVFVQSRNGNTGARDPSKLGGGNTDKHLIYEGLSRVAADAVLAGAETIRGGHFVFSVWHPQFVALRASLGLRRHPMQIVATLRGLDLDDALLFNLPDVPVCLLTTGSCATRMTPQVEARPWISVIAMASAQHLDDAMRRLREMGVQRISAVGGRHLATQLIDAGLVQDVYLTTSPVEAGEPGTPLYPRPLPGRTILRKAGTGAEIGVVFEHILLSRP